MDKIIHYSVILKCSPQVAFKLFTDNSRLESWLCRAADVEPVVGGKYELFWNLENKEIDSTIGCKVSAVEPGKFISFEWKGPQQFSSFMNTARPLTHVVVMFFPGSAEASSTTSVQIIHSGWRDSEDWDEARKWFEAVWKNALEELGKTINRQ